ncbi:MAG: hypothetical protein AAGJ46_19720 [Planctomycetota bacterium]
MTARLCLAGVTALAASLVADSAMAQGGVAQQQINQFTARNDASQFTSSRYVAQARNRGVAVNNGFGGGNINPMASNRPASSFGGGGGSSLPRSKPFSSIQRRPSVSPYLGLFNTSFDDQADALAYQTIVRPQLRQQQANRQQAQFNQRMQQEAFRLNSRLQSIQAGAGFNPQGNQNLMPTGTGGGVYRNYLHYYPRAR